MFLNKKKLILALSQNLIVFLPMYFKCRFVDLDKCMIFLYRYPGWCTRPVWYYKQPSRSNTNRFHCQLHDFRPHFWVYGRPVQSKICHDCRNHDLVCSHTSRIFYGGLFVCLQIYIFLVLHFHEILIINCLFTLFFL